MDDAARRERALARQGRMVLHKATLSAHEQDLDPVRGEEALSLVTALTRQAWSLSGQPFPSYSRDSIPVRFVPRVRP